MKNEKSYTEIMKSRTIPKKNPKAVTMLDIYIQMILDEALILRRKSILEEKINHALDANDRVSFLELSKEYCDLVR